MPTTLVLPKDLGLRRRKRRGEGGLVLKPGSVLIRPGEFLCFRNGPPGVLVYFLHSHYYLCCLSSLCLSLSLMIAVASPIQCTENAKPHKTENAMYTFAFSNCCKSPNE